MGLSPGAWGAPKRGMPTGSEAFLKLPIALGSGPATGPTLKTALCHIRTLVGRRINTARDRLWLRAAQFVRVCSTLGFNPLQRGWVYRPVPLKRGMPTGSEAFLELPVALGFGPATWPTLKTGLCHIRTLVGRRINNGTRPWTICRCLPPDRTWHKVKSPKAD